MADAKSYTAALIEDNLGLPRGQLKDDLVPREISDMTKRFLKELPIQESYLPVLEEAITSFSKRLRKEALEELGHYVSKAKWPEAKPSAVCVTHDVDNVRRSLSHILARRDRFSTKDLVLAFLGLRSLYDNVRHVARLERERGIRSTFYFLTSEYDLRQLAREVESLRKGGWEVGLHGDLGTHDSKEKMEQALGKFEAALGFRPQGVREHYLQFDFTKTWRVLEDAGFRYDTTVGNRDRLGFRAGLCTPFHPPDENWKPMRIIELPLVLMDTTLWGYLKMSEGDGLQRAKEMADLVSKAGGLFTLLWHQESVRMKGGRQFVPLLNYLTSAGCYIAPAAEIAKWWEARSVPLVREGNVYRLQGAPNGMMLELAAREELKPHVKGGSVEKRENGVFVRVYSDKFELRFE